MRPVLLAGALLLAGRSLLGAGPANDDCLTCHGDAGAVREKEKTPVFVDEKVFAGSVHGAAGMACTDCHADLAAAEFPHAEKLARVDCSPCHDQQAGDYAKSFHAASHARNPASRAARCVDCHGSHGILPSKDPNAPTSHFKLPGTCLRCHGDPAIYKKAHRLKGNDPAHFADSIHGKALLKAGLTVAPNCATCHGYHEIRTPRDAGSTVNRVRVPATCGACHAGILSLFEQGVHGQALKKGNPNAPVCIDCHSAHEVIATETARWRLDVIKECGTCHESLIHSYRDTYHGQVTELGFTRVATCADCHSAHDIFGKADPRSTVAPARRLATCQKCHPGTSPNFAKYDPHADPRDKARNPLLFYTGKFMALLLVSVFGFFGLHTVLWIPRSFQARRAKTRRNGNGGGK